VDNSLSLLNDKPVYSMLCAIYLLLTRKDRTPSEKDRIREESFRFRFNNTNYPNLSHSNGSSIFIQCSVFDAIHLNHQDLFVRLH